MRTLLVVLVGTALGASIACGDVNQALRQLVEARRLSADLHVQFGKAADAANRAVMSATDERSTAFAREAEAAVAAVEQDLSALRPLLDGLDYPEESRLLEEFASQFAEYRTLDRNILELAVQNTNTKAKGLAFGPGLAAADAFRDALNAVQPAQPARDQWQVAALAARAVAAVREIQAVQPPHIADADDAAMTRMEQRITAAVATARTALGALAPLAAPTSRPHLAAAAAALDRFLDLNTQIIDLSRRNTNVRSLVLSLDEKRTLTIRCENSLRALQNALARRGYPAGRV